MKVAFDYIIVGGKSPTVQISVAGTDEKQAEQRAVVLLHDSAKIPRSKSFSLSAGQCRTTGSQKFHYCLQTSIAVAHRLPCGKLSQSRTLMIGLCRP